MARTSTTSHLLPNISYEGNFAAEQGRLLQAEAVFTLVENKLNRTIPKYSDKYEADNNINIDEACRKELKADKDKIDNCKKVASTLTKLIAELNDLNRFNVHNVEYYSSQVFIKKLQILALKIKKLLLNVKMRISEYTKNLLCSAIVGRASEILMPIIGAILMAFQALSQMLSGLLMGIQTVLNLIPEFLKVNPEGMTFFMTPKSMQNVKINAVNSNQSITNRLPDAVKTTISKVLKSNDIANIAIRKANIAAAAVKGAASARTLNGKFDYGMNKHLIKLDSASILKQVDNIVSLIPIPQSLPKYEKLSLTNLGFLAWCMTGWCPAGKQCFGFPYYP